MTLYALVLINHETFHFMKTVVVLSNRVSTISKRERVSTIQFTSSSIC